MYNICIYIYLYIYVYIHICIYIYIYIADILYVYMVKSVPIFMARNRVSKSCLMTDLCFHRFVHFNCIPITTGINISINQKKRVWKNRIEMKLTTCENMLKKPPNQ